MNEDVRCVNVARLLSAPLNDRARTVYLAIVFSCNKAGVCTKNLDDIGSLCTRHTGKVLSKSGVSRAVSELIHNDMLISVDKGFSVVDFAQNQELSSQQQKGLILAKNGGVVITTTQEKREAPLPLKQPKQPSQPLKGDLFDLANRKNGAPNDNSIYFIDNNNIKNSTTKTLSNAQRETKKSKPNLYRLDDFTKEYFPMAPVPVAFCEEYFLGYFKRNKLDQDAHAAAMDFMEHWEHKKSWLYKRPGKDKFPTQIDAARVKAHLSTWAQNIKRGRYQYVPLKAGHEADTPKTPGQKIHPWLTYENLMKHSQMNGIQSQNRKWMDLDYETNGQKGKECRWRYIGRHEIKYTFGKVIEIHETI